MHVYLYYQKQESHVLRRQQMKIKGCKRQAFLDQAILNGGQPIFYLIKCWNKEVNRTGFVGDSIFWETIPMKKPTYTPEIRERAVQLLIESEVVYQKVC